MDFIFMINNILNNYSCNSRKKIQVYVTPMRYKIIEGNIDNDVI